MPEMYLSVKNLTHVYGRTALFSGLSLELPPRTLLQVTGRNGSGKTTLLKLLAVIKTPQEGSVEWADVDYTYLGHKNAIKGELSPLENLALYQPDVSICAHTLEERGLETTHHKRPCYRLSAGQQRKVALSRVILSNAKVWLLDEPFTALDEAAKVQLMRHLQRHADNGGSAVVATHEHLNVEKSVFRELVMA